MPLVGSLTNVIVDPSKPRSRRPLMGYDIEQWRGEQGLSKFKAQAALGFRNANHYNKICQRAGCGPLMFRAHIQR